MTTRPGPADLDDATIAFAHQMFDLARAGDLGLVEQVDAGLPPNLTTAKGDTLVMLAAYHGHAPLVAALTERGADVERINDRGQTPLAAAVFKGAADVVEVLLAVGADPHAGQPSALETAVFFEREEIAARLSAAGGEQG